MKLWVPPSAVEQVNYRCACGQEFQDVAKGRRHAVACATKGGADELAEKAVAHQEAHAPLDPDQWFWGRKRIAEGKVGFKRGQAA